MVSRLKKHEAVLNVLAKAKPALVRKIIQPAHRDLIDAISECSLNILNGTIPLSPYKKKTLKRYVQKLRLLARKSTTVKKRKNIIQTGSGLLTAVLGTVLPLAAKGITYGIKAAIAHTERKKRQRKQQAQKRKQKRKQSNQSKKR